MAEETFRNPNTGETIVFLKTARDTGGAVFRMGYTMAPGATIAEEHCHPHQEMSILLRHLA